MISKLTLFGFVLIQVFWYSVNGHPSPLQVKIASWNMRNNAVVPSEPTKDRLKRMLKSHMPDFLGVQECSLHFDKVASYYKSTLNECKSLIFHVSHYSPLASLDAVRMARNPIYYNSAEWKLLDDHSLILNGNESTLSSARFQHHKVNDHTVCLLNTHLTPIMNTNLTKFMHMHCRPTDLKIFTGDYDVKYTANNRHFLGCGGIVVSKDENRGDIEFILASPSSKVCIQKRDVIYPSDNEKNYEKAAIMKTFCLGNKCNKCIQRTCPKTRTEVKSTLGQKEIGPLAIFTGLGTMLSFLNIF